MKKWKLKLNDCKWDKFQRGTHRGIHFGTDSSGTDSLHYLLDSGVEFVIESEVLSHVDLQMFNALKTKYDTLSDNLNLRIKAFQEEDKTFQEKYKAFQEKYRAFQKKDDRSVWQELRDKQWRHERQKLDNERQKLSGECQKLELDDEKLDNECQKLDNECQKLDEGTQIKPELTALHDALISFSANHCINISATDNLWLYDGWVFKTTREYEQEEAQLLILEEIDKERRKFERLKAKFSSTHPDKLGSKRREKIPTEVRIEVWRRDNGQCVRCESRERLEYDHIIPVSEGGSSTARNIELLCEKCNREKSNKIE